MGLRSHLLPGAGAVLCALAVAACSETDLSSTGSATRVSSTTSAPTLPLPPPGTTSASGYRREVDVNVGNYEDQYRAASASCHRRLDARCLTWLQVLDRARAQLVGALDRNPAPADLRPLDAHLRRMIDDFSSALQRLLAAVVEADPVQGALALRDADGLLGGLEGARRAVDTATASR